MRPDPAALCAVLAALVVGSVGCAPPDRPSAVAEAAPAANDVDSVLALVADRPFNGVALVARDGRVVGAATAGWADREAGAPLRRGSRFVIGSVSKQVTATLVLREVDAGRLSLDTLLADVLGLDAPWVAGVRVRHLLNHTSGIVEEGEPPASAPGTAFAYSNAGYGLLGRVVERTTGEPFAQAASRLFVLCGMDATSVYAPAEPTGLVPGYDETAAGGFVRASRAGLEDMAAAGGVVSTADDLVRWTSCLHGGRVLSPARYREMVRPSATRPHRWGPLGYGYGVQVASPGGVLELSHTGQIAGFTATVATYPASGLTLVVLENTSWDDADPARATAPHDRLRDAVVAAARAAPSAAPLP
ncbi:MAG TPA: serine hydrolase domain-containing protein [Rubricoccaceae bacterium]